MKSIVITGASSGIGKETAKYFAEQGWKVAATMRTPDKETELTEIDNVSLYQRDFRLDLVDADTVSAPRLFERSEVPIDLRDRNGNGTFDAGDGIVFWGRSVRDQWMTSGWEHEDRHDVVNAYWVRIDRSGDTLTGFVSPDGETWTQMGDPRTIAMDSPALIGLAVTSHNVDQATSAVFSNVSITGASGDWQIEVS